MSVPVTFRSGRSIVIPPSYPLSAAHIWPLESFTGSSEPALMRIAGRFATGAVATAGDEALSGAAAVEDGLGSDLGDWQPTITVASNTMNAGTEQRREMICFIIVPCLARITGHGESIHFF